MLTALLVIGILVLLIVVHEFGHFIVAKLFGVQVDEFGIGYPPRAFSFGRWGGTEYTLNWIPFGGFVRLFGDEGEGQHGRGSLVDSQRGVQAAILVAGVAMNALIAWVLFAGALHAGIPRVVDTLTPGQDARLMIVDVVPGSPADAAGIAAGDQILDVADAKNVKLATLPPDALMDFVKARVGSPLRISYLHIGATTTAEIIPAHAVIPQAGGRPAPRVALPLATTAPLSWGAAGVDAIKATRGAFVTVVRGLWDIVSGVVRGAPDLSSVVGPLGLVQVVGEASQNGFGNVLALAGFISVNLAIINLIPIPALDGGRLLLLGVEAGLRRSAPKIIVQLINALGIALIVLLMVTVTYHDIGRLLA